MDNQAVFMIDVGKFEIRDIEMPDLGSGQVLIRIESVSICGSDVHFFSHGRIGDCVAEPPFILGHECAGTIVEKNEDVKNFNIGDRVAIEPGIPCGKCKFCKSGRYNLCPDMIFMACPPHQGALRRYIAYPSDMVYKLPDTMTMHEGALIEPLAVGIHAAGQGEVGLGDAVLVNGCGCIGLMTMLAAFAGGAGSVAMTDIIDFRLEKALEFGATGAINAARQDVISEADRLTDGEGFDVVIDATGNTDVIARMPDLVKPGGAIVFMGQGSKDTVNFCYNKAIVKELMIKSVFRYRNIYPVAINAVSSGKINLKPMITREFDFSDSQEAFDYTIKHKDTVLKSVIKI